MARHTRREFLADVGRGMLVAGLGYATALDLGVTTAWADDDKDAAIEFGPVEPLVRLMQDTPAERLLPLLAERLRTGATLQDLVAAAALANARTFGGQDYIGFHTFMALAPAWYMSRELPRERQPLPVMKVLFRNSQRIQDHGGHDSEVLKEVLGDGVSISEADGARLLEAVRQKDVRGAEQTFARISERSPEEAFNELLIAVQNESEVHRVVLPYRAWDLLDIVGREHAHTLLRQSVRYCVKAENSKYSELLKGGRDVLPRYLDEYKLLARPIGTRDVPAEWIDEMSRTIFASEPDAAAEAVAAALAEGIAPDAIGQAMSLAANQLVLRDAGRPANEASAEKPLGSVHGDSIGVHACDSANAWRNMARVSNQRNTCACLILGAHQVATDRIRRGGNFLEWEPYPRAEHVEALRATSPERLLTDAEAAIREKDQARACAAVALYGESGAEARPAFDLLLKYATSEDGALHAEKYYRTVSEEFASTHPDFRWRQLAALARVTASEFGRTAPGYEQAESLLPTISAS